MILVTGATGTNGKEVIQQLVAAGASQVKALVRDPAKADPIQQKGVELVQGDLSQPETLESALQGVKKALLIAPFNPNQVEWETNFITAAKRAGLEHLVKFSVLAADPNAAARIMRWHGEIEQQLAASGIPYTLLQPNSFMQNRFTFAQTIKEQGTFYEPVGDGKISHVDVRDIAAVAVKTLTEEGHVGKSYAITGPEALSAGEVAEKMSAVLGKKVTYVDVPPADFKSSLMNWGVPEWFVDGLNELYDFYRASKASSVTHTIAEVAQKQPIFFDQFLQDFAQAFK